MGLSAAEKAHLKRLQEKEMNRTLRQSVSRSVHG